MGFGLSHYIPIVVYLTCFIVALLTIFHRVEWSLLFLVFFIPLQNVLQKMRAYPFGKDVVDILVVAALIGWFLGSNAKGSRIFEKTSLNLPLFLYIIVTYIGLWTGFFYLGGEPPYSLSSPEFIQWKNLVLLPILYFITVNNVRNRKWMNFIIISALCSMFMVDHFFYKDFGWVRRWHYTHDMRIGGPFTYLGPNELGAFFVQYGMIALGLLCFARSHLERVLLGSLCAFSTYCLLYTFSRAAYLAVIAGAAFLTFFKNKKIFIAFLILLAISPRLLPVSVIERIQMTFLSDEEKIERGMTNYDTNGTQSFDASTEGRFNYFDMAMDMFKRKPVLGMGFHSFSRLHGRDTHNNYAKFLAELGMVGLAIYLYLYYLAFRSGWHLYKMSEERLLKGLGLGFAACVIANMAMNVTHDNWTYINLMGIYWIFLGLVVRGKMILEEKSE